MKIAIVEDEIRIREGLRHLLLKADPDGEVVAEAENGQEGVDLLLKHRPELVLADIRMPVLDGIEMLRTVQAQGFSPVVIFLSAYSDFSYAQQAVKLGVSEYLVKPVAADELIAAVRRAKELIERQAVAKQGRRTLSDVLTDALTDRLPPNDATLHYIQSELGWQTDEPLAVLVMHPTAYQAKCWPRIVQAAGLGRLETVRHGEEMVTVFQAFGDNEHMAFDLEKRILPQTATQEEAPPIAVLGFAPAFTALNETYRALLAHLDYGLIARPGQLLRYPELTEWELKLLAYPIELETAARAALGKHDDPAVAARLRDFGRLFEAGQLYAPREIKEAFVRFAWALLSTARELGVRAAEGLSRQALLESIMSAVRKEQLDKLLRELSDLLCDPMKPDRPSASPLVRRAMGLMSEHFAQGITLEEIAQKLSVTPEYLGTQIHRELGVTFGTLMKRLRVERAKELFLTTDQKLYEVALSVGYADAKYFSGVFRQVTGMLPSEFRRLNK